MTGAAILIALGLASIAFSTRLGEPRSKSS